MIVGDLQRAIGVAFIDSFLGRLLIEARLHLWRCGLRRCLQAVAGALLHRRADLIAICHVGIISHAQIGHLLTHRL